MQKRLARICLTLVIPLLIIVIWFGSLYPIGEAMSFPNPEGETTNLSGQEAVLGAPGNRPSASFNEGEPLTAVITKPPVASLISVGSSDQQHRTEIIGSPGAVEPDGLLAVACLDTTQVIFLLAETDGSFSTTLYAPPGSYIQIKHAYPFISLTEIEATFGGTIAGDIMAGWMNATAGTIVRVPLAHSGTGGGIPFGFAGPVANETGVGYWSVEGTLGQENPVGGGIEFPVTATLRVTTPALTPGMDLSGLNFGAKILLRRYFDQNGRQIPIDQTLVSNFLTPTGLPISRGSPNWSPVEAPVFASGWQQAGDQSLTTTLTATLFVSSTIQPGHYFPRLNLFFDGFPLGPPNNRTMRPGFLYGFPRWDLPLVQIGVPAQPRLLWTLLTNTLYEGTRGSIAREDRDEIGLIPLTSFQDGKFIIPKIDARTGESITYSLEPYLPLVSITDRGLPNAPLLPFVLPGGELQVEVGKPDGSTDVIGPAPFAQSSVRTPAFPSGRLRDNDGGSLQDVYQLTTMAEGFNYTFSQYGHHLITVTGYLEDEWGNSYEGSGTFDVHVARRLKVEPAQLPTTPYELDDVFTYGMHVYPPLPAQVTVNFILLPNSDPALAITRTISGTANRYGYFHPPLRPSDNPWSLDAPGEYRVDIHAEYTGEDGIQWAGSVTYGGVVERPGTPLIAHGRRGLDAQGLSPQNWFFHENLNFDGIAHTNYPYLSGDIFWGSQKLVTNTHGADSILPVITIQDTVGDLETLIQNRWDKPHVPILPWETLQDRIDLDELPLFSSAATGVDALWAPVEIDQFGYAYRTSERADARVHETVSEEGLGIAYWRYNAPYGDQVGYEGDLPHDLKWEFGGAVYRTNWGIDPIHEYAIYGSLWVLTPDDDPLGPRVTLPFQGTAGGPNGGPILTLKGEEIDMFFLPRGVQPGDTLEVGDIFSFSGHIGPPLAAQVAITLTSPLGATFPITGTANKVGWFYNPSLDIPVEEPGLWTVQVAVSFTDPIPSTGLAPTDHNTGGVLGVADGLYAFYVVEPVANPLHILSPTPGFLAWPEDIATQRPVTLTTVPIEGSYPFGLTDVEVAYTMRMPGYVLATGILHPINSLFMLEFDPIALHEDFPNLDLTTHDQNQVGLADPVLISLLLSGDQSGVRVYCSAMVFMDGDEVFLVNGSPWIGRYLPLIQRN